MFFNRDSMAYAVSCVFTFRHALILKEFHQSQCVFLACIIYGIFSELSIQCAFADLRCNRQLHPRHD